jgi:hypothetical protein
LDREAHRELFESFAGNRTWDRRAHSSQVPSERAPDVDRRQESTWAGWVLRWQAGMVGATKCLNISGLTWILRLLCDQVFIAGGSLVQPSLRLLLTVLFDFSAFRGCGGPNARYSIQSQGEVSNSLLFPRLDHFDGDRLSLRWECHAVDTRMSLFFISFAGSNECHRLSSYPDALRSGINRGPIGPDKVEGLLRSLSTWSFRRPTGQ